MGIGWGKKLYTCTLRLLCGYLNCTVANGKIKVMLCWHIIAQETLIIDDHLRLGRFSLWISAAEFPDDDIIARRAVGLADILAVEMLRNPPQNFRQMICFEEFRVD